MKKRYIFTLIFLSLILLFHFPMMRNEYRLYFFQKQLDKVEKIFPAYFKEIARGSNIYVASNDEACTYLAVRVYYLHGNNEDDLKFKKAFEKLQFKNSQPTDSYSPPDKDLINDGLTVVIKISDGPYPAGFDYRCW